MHECPECQAPCDCDGEDTWIDSDDECVHDCGERDDDAIYYD